MYANGDAPAVPTSIKIANAMTLMRLCSLHALPDVATDENRIEKVTIGVADRTLHFIFYPQAVLFFHASLIIKNMDSGDLSKALINLSQYQDKTVLTVRPVIYQRTNILKLGLASCKSETVV